MEGCKVRYLKLLEDLPLHTLLLVEAYDNAQHVLKVSFFFRRTFEVRAYIYATSIELFPDDLNRERHLHIMSVPLDAIISWKLWTPRIAPLTINWSMSDWYKMMAFGK